MSAHSAKEYVNDHKIPQLFEVRPPAWLCVSHAAMLVACRAQPLGGLDVCVCVCVCVRERERERKRAHAALTEQSAFVFLPLLLPSPLHPATRNRCSAADDNRTLLTPFTLAAQRKRNCAEALLSFFFVVPIVFFVRALFSVLLFLLLLLHEREPQPGRCGTMPAAVQSRHPPRIGAREDMPASVLLWFSGTLRPSFVPATPLLSQWPPSALPHLHVARARVRPAPCLLGPRPVSSAAALHPPSHCSSLPARRARPCRA